MKNMLFGLIALFCLGSLTTFVSCKDDESLDEFCTVCSYERPDNGDTVTADELCRSTEEALDTWEQTFRNEVNSPGGAWADVEVTCERQ